MDINYSTLGTSFFVAICIFIAVWVRREDLFSGVIELRKKREEKKKNPSSTNADDKKNQLDEVWEKVSLKWKGNVFPVVVGGIFLFIILAIVCEQIWPGWFWNQISSYWFIIIVLGFLIFGMMKKPNDKSPFKHKLATIGLAITTLIVITKFLIVPIAGSPKDWLNREMSAPPLPISTTPRPFLPPNPEIEKVVREFWGSNTLMAEICGKESGFNQLELDGTPYRGRENSMDVGVCQINEGWWLSQSQVLGPKYSLYTLDGNLEMARWIYEHRGADEWNTFDEATKIAQEKGLPSVAPVGPDEWSEKIATPGPFIFDSEGPVWVRTSRGGEPIRFDMHDKTEVGRTTYLQFQSRIEVPVNVIVTRQ